jgi:hypothetical protein
MSRMKSKRSLYTTGRARSAGGLLASSSSQGSTLLDQPWSDEGTAGPWQLLAAMPELEKSIDDKRHS